MAAEDRAASFLQTPDDHRPLPLPAAATELLHGLGPTAGKKVDALPFSVFIREHQEAALKVVAELMEIANANPGEAGLEKVLDRVQQVAAETSLDLAKYALMVFITHHPEGQRLPIPPLEQRDPAAVQPSPTLPQAKLSALGAFGDEAKLDWYREDASANDHHFRWHVVYPNGGIPDPKDPTRRITKDRQGELFLYMHEQMLARYDTERLGVGLGKATPLTDYTVPVPQGYLPLLTGFDNRQPDSLMTRSTFPGASTNDLATWDNALFPDVLANKPAFHPTATRTALDLVGSTVEASAGSVDRTRYGNLHNMGHMVLALIPDPKSTGPQQGGVMRSTAVAIRDPIFYRWHRHVDDLGFGWQERQPAQKFDDAPNVTIRDVLSGAPACGKSPDVIVCLADKVTGDAQAFGDSHFGGASFDKDPAASGVTSDTVKTFMRTRTIAGTTVSFLDHEDFFYFIRVKNEENKPQHITVRIFLAATEWMDDRRRWIELDRFQHQLAANQKAVIARSSKESSVARKPALRPDQPKPAPDPGSDPNYCDCGWPYHLLLPRGNAAGMGFRLLVVLTNWEIDRVDVDGKCGSMSFCGKRDALYPDKRPMGYPFDRKWPGKIPDLILAQKQMAGRDIKIKLS